MNKSYFREAAQSAQSSVNERPNAKKRKWLLYLLSALALLLFIVPVKAEAGELSTGWYAIYPSNNSVRLNTEDSKSNITLKKPNNNAGQKFYVQKQSDGSYKIGTGTTAGLSVLSSDKSQQKWNKNDKQKWLITPSGDNYTIKNKSTGKYLSFSGTTLNVNSTASLWRFQPYSERYTITFKSEDGKTLKRELVTKINDINAPTVPTVANKVFVGWSGNYKNVKENTVVTANYATPSASIDTNDDGTYVSCSSDDITKPYSSFIPGGEVYYPRIKKIGDWYLVTYATKTSGTIYYTTSKDLINWSKPTIIWEPFSYSVDGKEDTRSFMNPDIEILNNGDIYIYANYRSINYPKTKPELNGLCATIGKLSNGKLIWNNPEKTEDIAMNIGFTAFTSNCVGWEPSIVKKGDALICTYSTGFPASSIFGHSPSATGVSVSRDGINWSTPQMNVYLYTGTYTKNEKTVNYYTAQMPNGVWLKDKRFYYVYETWLPEERNGFPSGYSISANIFSKNYNFTHSHQLSVLKVTNNSLLDLNSTTSSNINDPRRKNTVGGDILSFKKITQGTSPDIIQMPSGEVIISYSKTDNKGVYNAIIYKDKIKEFKIFDSKINTTTLWGALEKINNKEYLTIASNDNHTGFQIEKCMLKK